MFFWSVMHTAITDLAADTLSHAKQLIKEMDASWFSYNREEMIVLLYTLKEMHAAKHEQKTIDHVHLLISSLEQIEYAYHERIYIQSSHTLTSNIQDLLDLFHQDRLHSVPITHRVYHLFHEWWKKSWALVEVLLLVMLLMLTLWSVYMRVHIDIWYVLIWCAFLALFIVGIKWMWRASLWAWVTLMLLFSTLWVWVMI